MRRPILIIGAMDPEIDFLVEKLDDKKSEKLRGYNVYEGKIEGHPIVVAQSEVGIINASILTTLAIEKYNPLCILNEGTAGGFGRTVHKGDIIIGTQCFNIMSAKTPYKEEGEGSDSLDWDYITFVNGGKDEKKVENANEKLIEIIKKTKPKYENGKLYVGVIGSGDIWNCEKDKILYLNEKHGVLCEEMEGIAVYTVANKYKIPVVGIRVISDNEILREEYDRNLGRECQKFVYEIVKKLI